MTTATLPQMGTPEHAALVARQNDQFRRWHTIGERKPGIYVPGRSVWTAAFEARETAFKRAALQAIGAFDDFTVDNDPAHFHDFGAVQVMGETVWFKVDLYDQTYTYGSEDPADLRATRRVLTILFPAEW